MRVDVIDRRRRYDGFLKVDEARLRHERFDGTMSAEVRREVLERGDSVAAIVFHTGRRRVVLIEQFRWPTYDKGPGWLLEVAAGMLEPGEEPADAMRRELVEELGYTADRIEPIATFYVSPGGTSERIVLMGVEVDDAGRAGDGGGLAAEGEDIRAVELDLDALAAAVRDGRIADAKTLIAVTWLLERHGRPAWGPAAR